MSGTQISQPPYIDEAFVSPPIYNALFSCLGPGDLIRAGKTCRLLYAAVKDFHQLAFNINRHLECFVKDPIALRKLQANTEFLIAGSTALQFLDRTFYPGSDLDIFAYPATVKEIGRHLTRVEGYVFEPRASQVQNFEELSLAQWREGEDPGSWVDPFFDDDYWNGSGRRKEGMEDMLRFKDRNGELEIQIIVCRRSPLDCIFYFYSSSSFLLVLLAVGKAENPAPRSLCHELHCLRCRIFTVPQGNLRLSYCIRHALL